MQCATIKQLFAYHYGMFEQVWGCLTALSEAQFLEECDYSLGSLRNQLAHCLLVDRLWLARMQGAALPADFAEEDIADRASLKARWDAAAGEVLDYINGLTAEALDEVVRVHLPHRYPEPKTCTRRQILLHMVNHGTDHRAQILARLHNLSAPTFEQDAMLYWWARDAN